MIKVLNHAGKLALITIWAGVLFSCTTSKQPTGGSETNWLKLCVAQEDCSDENTCQCGICTRSCRSAADCSESEGAATCLVTEPLDDGSCRVVAAGQSDQGVCVARCEKDKDCDDGEDFQCISGVCVAIIHEDSESVEESEGSYGLILPGMDAEVSEPSSDKDSSLSDDASIGPSTTQDSSDLAWLDDGDGEGMLLGPLSKDIFPDCPCSTDLEEGARAPKIDDVEANAYGGPELIWGINKNICPDGIFIFTEIREVTPTPGLEDSYSTEYEGLTDLCLSFSLCYLSCISDIDCPRVDSGNAVPRCNESGECYLDCGAQRSCPDDMICITGVDKASCLWADDLIEPGCPAFCEQEPMPRDCPNYCASDLMACDPDKDLICCEGLTCSEEGYCVQD